MPAQTRSFEFSEGASDKFWIITLNGTLQTVRFGRQGTSGQEQTKEFSTEASARTSCDKLVAEKLKKGYREVGEAPREAPPKGEARPSESGAPNALAGTWEQIDKWLKANSPKTLKTLNPPATDQQLAELERGLGIALPPDLRASLQIHNGQKNPKHWMGLMNCWRLMSCKEIAGLSRGMAQLLDQGDFDDRQAEGRGGVKSDWWNKRWIPFLEGGDGNSLCIDLDPDVDGREVQVIEFWHADNDRSVVAGSLAGFLSRFVDDLLHDKYGVDDDGRLER